MSRSRRNRLVRLPDPRELYDLQLVDSESCCDSIAEILSGYRFNPQTVARGSLQLHPAEVVGGTLNARNSVYEYSSKEVIPVFDEPNFTRKKPPFVPPPITPTDVKDEPKLTKFIWRFTSEDGGSNQNKKDYTPNRIDSSDDGISTPKKEGEYIDKGIELYGPHETKIPAISTNNVAVKIHNYGVSSVMDKLFQFQEGLRGHGTINFSGVYKKYTIPNGYVLVNTNVGWYLLDKNLVNANTKVIATPNDSIVYDGKTITVEKFTLDNTRVQSLDRATLEQSQKTYDTLVDLGYFDGSRKGNSSSGKSPGLGSGDGMGTHNPSGRGTEAV